MPITNTYRIVLTGASRGLGLAMTAGFISAGHTVCGCARSLKAVNELYRRWPSPHTFDVVDVSQDDQVANWAERVLHDGPVDLLINNAAIINRNEVLWNFSAAEIDEIIDVNIKGVINCIRHFVPAMVQRKRGVIINLSSGWGRATSPEMAPYCTTKFAIEGLTQALSQELPDGMAAIPLNPGIIDTDMLRSCWAEGAGSYRKPEAWAKIAVPFILGLGAPHSGVSVSVP